jgi:ESCRT-I complex subunit VPS28
MTVAGNYKEDALRTCSNAAQREELENKAEMYSIFVATEHLERGFVKDCVPHDEYTSLCNRLITQFKTCRTSLGANFDVRTFVSEYDVRCPLALHRLLDAGIPATAEHTSAASSSGNQAKHVAETVQHFITLLDALRMNLTAVDQIHPQLLDLAQSLSNVTSLPPTFGGHKLVVKWLMRLNQMRASDELSADDVRQLLFELDGALSDFHRALANS